MNDIAAISNWLSELQEQVDGLAAVLATLSKQDPETPDPFTDVFADQPPVDPEPVERKPTPSELMEKIWSMESGSKMDFLDGHIELIRKPGTYPPIQYRGFIVTDPGCIRILHVNIKGGQQHLSVRAPWRTLAGRFPEISIWMRRETGVSDWGKEYDAGWGSVEAHQRRTLYNIDTGLTHAYGEWTCAGAKPKSRVKDAPDYAALKKQWIN